jgi:hypothetical protein
VEGNGEEMGSGVVVSDRRGEDGWVGLGPVGASVSSSLLPFSILSFSVFHFLSVTDFESCGEFLTFAINMRMCSTPSVLKYKIF